MRRRYTSGSEIWEGLEIARRWDRIGYKYGGASSGMHSLSWSIRGLLDSDFRFSLNSAVWRLEIGNLQIPENGSSSKRSGPAWRDMFNHSYLWEMLFSLRNNDQEPKCTFGLAYLDCQKILTPGYSTLVIGVKYSYE